MTRRILLNSSALKVSQPGVDVLTADPDQLFFSSDWSAMGLAQSGDIVFNTWPDGNNGDRRWRTTTITLDKSFPSPPAVAFYIVQDDALTPVGFGSGCFFGWLRSAGDFDYDRVLCYFKVNNSSISVRAMFDKEYTPSLAEPSFRIRYFVFEYNT